MKQKGFTLIELLVAITLVMIIGGVGIASFGQTNRRETLTQNTEKLKQTLLQARSNALSGKKDTVACGANPLDGWEVVVLTNGYTVRGKCGVIRFSSQTVVYPTSVSNSPTPTILFKTLGQGVTGSAVITVTGTSGSNSITVTSTGEVK